MSELMFKWSKYKTTVVMETLDQNCYRLYATLYLSFRAHLDLGNYHAFSQALVFYIHRSDAHNELSIFKFFILY